MKWEVNRREGMKSRWRRQDEIAKEQKMEEMEEMGIGYEIRQIMQGDGEVEGMQGEGLDQARQRRVE